jgi:hypothetical protein
VEREVPDKRELQGELDHERRGVNDNRWVGDLMNEEEDEWLSFTECGDSEIVHPISGPPAGTGGHRSSVAAPAADGFSVCSKLPRVDPAAGHARRIASTPRWLHQR